jgi:hypothetical protein
MPGLRQHLVTEIARTLRDRYHSGFPILKELIQNADDAEASRIVFGHHLGFGSSTKHPLLSGPALWVFNDGKFKRSDATAIEYFGINTKAGDDAAIGKFGLGMKSVFHLCEAFFYVAYDGAEIHRRILNPWYSDVDEEAFHNGWEDVSSADWEMLHEIGRQHVKSGTDSWFLMWIPLRKKTHKRDDLGHEVGAIVDRFPGDSGSTELEFLRERDLERSLAFVLPLLKHLKTIEHVGDERFPGFDVRIECQNSVRLDHQTPELKIAGQVIGAKASGLSIKFAGLQTSPAVHDVSGRVFEKLRALDAWPKSFRLNEQRHFEQVRDKSRAEASVVLQAIDGDVGRLSLDWAVFLPMEEGTNSYATSISGSSRHYRFVLHGQFFVDAGRRGINGYAKLADRLPQSVDDLDEAGLAIRWNQSVAQGLVLPNLLKVMAEFVHQARLSDDDITAMTHALQLARSESGQFFYSKYRGYVCQDQSWACVMSPEGRAWRLIQMSTTQRLLPLPKAPNDEPQRPWKVLPGLHNLGDSIFYDASKPRLAVTDNTWDETSLTCALAMPTDADLMRAFGTPVGLDYLASFFSQEEKKYVVVSVVQDALFSLVRRAFRLIPLSEIRKNGARFRSVLQVLDRKRRVSIGTADPAATNAVPATVFSALFSVDSSALLLPRDLDPNDSDQVGVVPSDDDLSAWLRCIDRIVGQEADARNIVRLLGTAEYLLKLCASEAERASLLLANRDLRVVKAECPRTAKPMACSLNTLLDLQQRGNLFLFSGSLQEKLGLVPLLARAIPDEKLRVVDSASGKILKEAGAGIPLQSSSPSDVLLSLGGQRLAKILGGESDRLALIKKSHEGMQDVDTRRGLRYLLHGSPDQFQDLETPLWIEPGHNNSPWIKTWKMIEEANWNVLPSTLANAIPPSQWEAIGLRSVDPTEVIARLLQINDFSVIDPLDFSSSERDSILGAINDKILWCSMPLHRDIDGHFGAISPKTFLQTDRRVPAELVSGCRIIEASDDTIHSGKQLRFLCRFDFSAIIDAALGLEHPVTVWHLLLEELSNIEETQLDSSLLAKLRTIAWVPLHNGEAIRPADVIDVPDLAEDIDRLASKAGYCFSGIGALDEGFRSHRGFSSAKRLFSSGEEAAKQFGLLLAEVDDYHVGSIRPVSDQEIQELISSLVALELPGWRAVRRCCDVFGSAVVCAEILPNIQNAIPIVRVSSALKALLSEPLNSPAYIATFCRYLALFPSYPRNQALVELKTLKLLTKQGTWRISTDLCDGGIGLDSSYVLDPTFSQILGNLIVRVGDHEDGPIATDQELPEFEAMVKESPQVIGKYFAPWESLVRPETVGAFVALFGKQLRELAEKWLQSHSADWLYDNLGWQVPGVRSDGAGGWMQGCSTSDAFSLLRVGVRVIHGEELDVPNLFGNSIRVPLASVIENLVAGGFYWKGGYSVEVRIREIPDLSARSASELSDILRKSATYVLQHAYDQSFADLTALWEVLQESDQLDLSVARALILDHLPFVLRDQIGAQKRSVDLAKVLKSYDKARRAKTEAEQSAKPGAAEHGNLDTSLKKSLEALANLLVDRDDVQMEVLSAVRDKLHDYQYDISGILFELFQNADDAVVELHTLNRDLHGDVATDDEGPIFVVDISKDSIRAMHWGRPINYCPPAIEDGRADDFRRDLEKMLILSSSDKSQKSGVTGKFGLGFKSVLLATDSPKVLSGDLRFEIIGGVLPQPWKSPGESAVVLGKYASTSRRRGTVTELPIDDHDIRSQMLDRFCLLSGLQSVFGRKIRDIRVSGAADPVPRGRWKAKTTIGEFELGSCDIPTTNGWSEARLLVFRGEAGCVALRSGSRGIERMDGHIPPFWVTAPTRESESVGFVVNGGFEVDAGRSRLASNSKHNSALAMRIGEEFGRELMLLYRNCEKNWESVLQSMDLAADVLLADYWASMWRAVYPRAEANDAEAHRLARIIVSESLRKLARESEKIPNGLHGRLSKFVMVTSPLVALPGSWRSDDVLQQLSGWAQFQKNYPESQWIADDLATMANEVCSLEIKKLTVKSLTACIEDGRCDAATALCLHLVAPKLLENLAWNDVHDARSAFASLTFQSQAGSWSSASSLLSEEAGSPDERLIVGFAPKNYLLSPEYGDRAVSFFLQCKNDRDLSVSDIAQFVLLADDDSSRRAALNYLALGDHARDIAILLRDRMSGSWLESIDDHKELLSDLPDEIWLEVLLRLRPQSIIYQGAFSPEEDELDLASGQEKLQRIAQWWETDGREKQKLRYEQQFWPANVSRDFAADPVDRRAWMTLFGLGLTQRMGRVKDSQHRGFIQSLDSKGWWNVFCNVKPQDDAFAWFNVLEEYGEKQIDNEEYGLWMDNFARLYRVARWLDVYVHVFRTIDQRADNQFGPLLNPGADPIFQGDDEAAAPSLERSLRNGQHLVIRELLRAGVLKSAHAERRAFIPSWSVRQFFRGLGFEEPQSSEEIYQILSDALDDPIFGGDFDIPIRIVAHDIVPLGTILRGLDG